MISVFLLYGSAALAVPPDVKYLFPAGGQRATTVEVAAHGAVSTWPARGWINRAGVDATALGENGKLAIVVCADAVPGIYWLRLHDTTGASAPVPFIVGTLPEILEVEPNNEPQTPQAVPASGVVVNGRLVPAGDVDVFAIELKSGQTLVAAVEAHELLASPCDLVLQIVSPRGIVLSQNDDERGLDPLLTFAAPIDGTYLVRLFGFPAAPDTSIALAGADTFVYRLTLTCGSFLDAALPAAVAQPAAGNIAPSTPSAVVPLGWNLPTDSVTATSVKNGVTQFTLFDPAWAGAVELPVVPHTVLVEAEPNGAGQPQACLFPATIGGQIGAPRDVDTFAFTASKGQSWRFELESRALGYPLDAVLELFDAAGKSLARVDDIASNADPELSFQVPADGEYRLSVSDLFNHGGPRFVYRLRCVPTEADFALTVEAHAFSLAVGAPLEVPLTIERRNGFAEAIDFEVTGLPEGVTMGAVQSLAGDESAKSVKLVLSAARGPYSGPIRIVGRSAGGLERSHAAQTTLSGRGVRTADLWLTVRDR
ncbi:MAG TPA: PPC domain-containing protein [Pirellulales bacterium]|nr:PPC domain-containing protein [Pirellulales bacterium]